MAVRVGTGAAEGGAVGALVGSPAGQAYLVGNVMESARASDCPPVHAHARGARTHRSMLRTARGP
jgi:hypothetical protein